MDKDYITIDFANNTIEVHNSSEQGIIEMSCLADKRAIIYAAAGLEIIDGKDLQSDIKALFQSLGMTDFDV